MGARSKIHILSEELLTAIVEQLITETRGYWLIKSVFPYLKTLRLVSPRFAYLKLIQTTLFDSIQLVASPKGIKTLTNVSRLVPFVKRVILVAPSYSWTLTRPAFDEIILAQAIQKYSRVHEEWTGSGSYAYKEYGYQEFVKQKWHGKLPVSDRELSAAFSEYHAEALAVKHLLEGGLLKEVWTRALTELDCVRQIQFRSARWDEAGCDQLHAQPDCIVRPHYHNPAHQEYDCRRVAAPVGDALFAAGVTCLAGANTKIEYLKVACAMTGTFDWEVLPGWERLDLSRLTTFKFQPNVKSIFETLEAPENRDGHGSEPESEDEDSDEDDHPVLDEFARNGEAFVAGRANDAIAAVLKKCRGSIEKFEYKRNCPMQWPGNEVIQLPKLKSLVLGSGMIRPSAIKAWITEMPSLEYFELFCTGISERRPRCWLDVFDAIRTHKRGMRVCFDQITANDVAEITLNYHTDDFESILAEEEDEDPWSDISRSLSLYLSDKIGYNQSLRAWLEYN